MNSRSNKFFLVTAGCISFLLLMFAHRQTLADLWIAWQTEEYSHGLLIPLVALLLAWHLLAEKKPVLRPSWLAVPFLVVSGLLQLVSHLSAFGMTEEYGLVIGVAGLSLGFLGREATRAIAPALFYLVFAVPLPHLVQATLSQKLQLLSSSLGVIPLDLLGIPVFQEGNVIDLGGYRLQVVEACSGLRYLFPLMSFGYLIAFLLNDRFWKRLILFLSSIPITIGLNALRITIIGLTVEKWGQGMAEGFIHSFEGWTIFLVCISILMTEAWILRYIGNHGSFRYHYLTLARGPLSSDVKNRPAPAVTSTLLVLCLTFLFGARQIESLPEITPQHPPLSGFPVIMGGWHGQQESMPKDVLEALNLSDYWIADYKRDDKEPPINLYIAYYASQRVGTTTHSPSNCIPGGGWQIENSRTEIIPLANGQNLAVTRLLIRKGNAGELVYYWFDERGHDLTETYGAKWQLLWDSIFMHRSDGALVRLVTPFGDRDNEAAASERLSGFLGLLYPQIRLFIPGATLKE